MRHCATAEKITLTLATTTAKSTPVSRHKSQPRFVDVEVLRHEEQRRCRLFGRRPRVRVRRPGEPGGEPQPEQEVDHQVGINNQHSYLLLVIRVCGGQGTS